jgi:hypothetical protein
VFLCGQLWRNGQHTAFLLFVSVCRCLQSHARTHTHTHTHTPQHNNTHTTHTYCSLIAHYLANGFDLQCRSSDNKRSNWTVCSDPSALFTGTEIHRKCTVRHNIVPHVSAHQNRHRPPILRKVKERQYIGNVQSLR